MSFKIEERYFDAICVHNNSWKTRIVTSSDWEVEESQQKNEPIFRFIQYPRIKKKSFNFNTFFLPLGICDRGT